MNFYPRWPGDYQRDTASLSLAEHGAYAILLDYYYATEQPLPLGMEQLFRICRAMSGEEQEAVRRVAERFFPVNDSQRHNKRADRELWKLAARIQAAKNNGEKGGRPRLQKPSDNPVGLPNKTQQKPTGVPSDNPEAKLSKPKPKDKDPNPYLNPKGTTETSHPGLSVSLGRSRERDATKKNGTRLELEQLPAPWREWALRQGSANVGQCWEEFRDYWIAIPGQRGRKADWLATWRNWVRRNAEMKGRKAPRAVDNRAASEEAKRQFHARHKPIIEATTE